MKNADIINQQNHAGNTPVDLGLVQGIGPINSSLLDNGAKLGVQDNVSNTSLHKVINELNIVGFQQIINHVVKSGNIDVFVVKNHDDLTPLDLYEKICSAKEFQLADCGEMFPFTTVAEICFSAYLRHDFRTNFWHKCLILVLNFSKKLEKTGFLPQC